VNTCGKKVKRKKPCGRKVKKKVLGSSKFVDEQYRLASGSKVM